ncbi:hypothetical protein, partial [Sphingomonas segetis]|uniref:hypothetical protein n=1 Tax=Sphingomonas segetis TaxID=1104779 RepID=UPI001E3C6CF3
MLWAIAGLAAAICSRRWRSKFGSSWVNLPRGQSSIQSLAEVLTVYRPTFEVVGEALEAYVNPH